MKRHSSEMKNNSAGMKNNSAGMKRKAAVIIAAVLAAMICVAGCQQGSGEKSDVSKESRSSTEVSAERLLSEPEKSEEGDPSFEELSAEESSKQESSQQEDSESSDESEDSVSSGEEESEKLEEASDESSEEPAYFFDDEQIATDYHTAVEFTDNAAFNAAFAENSLDSAYAAESRELVNETQMRGLAISYGEKWREEVDHAYNELYDLLNENPSEQEKLVVSQQAWVSSIEETESSFQAQAESEGTYGLLAADTAMMNYYKGRAAVLYEQIFVLTGSFSMKS